MMNKMDMKFVRYLFIIAVSAALVCSCSKEVRPGDPVQESAVTVIQAYQEGNSTKATYNGSEILWDANDALSVFTSGSSTSVKFDKEAGNNNYFAGAGVVNLNDIYVLYPYNSSASLSAGKITTTLKTTQTATPGSFAPDANLAVAYSENGDVVRFKNAVSYIKISYKTTCANSNIKKITFMSLSGTTLSGRVMLTPTVSNGAVTDVSVSVAPTNQGGVSYVELAGDILPNTDYYIVIPPVNLSKGYRITFTDSEGNKFSRDYKDDKNKAQLLRNQIAATGVKNIDNYEGNFLAYWRVTSASEFTGDGDMYLLVKNTSASSTGYRVFDENKTDVFISYGQPLVDKFAGGTVTGLSSKLSSWKSGGSAPLFMSHYVLYCFKDAYSDNGLQFTSHASEYIQDPSDLYAFTVSGSDSKEITFKMCYKYSGSKSTDVTLTDCYIEAAGGNAFKLFGKITQGSIDGLVDVFFLGKGSQFKAAVSPSDIHSGANRAVNAYTQIGFCGTDVTTVDGETTMSNCFMIRNYYLCNYPEPEAIWLYKKASKKLTFVNFYELFN